MSVKALEKQYAQVVAQYHEMLQDIKDMEVEAAEGLVSPEFIERLQEQIKPIKQNYEWWSYAMYTLHEPQRDSKKEKYRKQMSKKLAELDAKNSPDSRLAEGTSILKTLSEVK